MKRRLLSLLLCLSVTVSSISISAIAEDAFDVLDDQIVVEAVETDPIQQPEAVEEIPVAEEVMGDDEIVDEDVLADVISDEMEDEIQEDVAQDEPEEILAEEIDVDALIIDEEDDEVIEDTIVTVEEEEEDKFGPSTTVTPDPTGWFVEGKTIPSLSSFSSSTGNLKAVDFYIVDNGSKTLVKDTPFVRSTEYSITLTFSADKDQTVALGSMEAYKTNTASGLYYYSLNLGKPKVTLGYGDLELNATTFPDANLLKAIKAAVDENGDDIASAEEILGTTTLNLASKGIADITGLSNFSKLENLDFSGNLVTDFTLPAFPKLKVFKATGAGLTKLNTAACASLENINVSQNNLTSVNFSSNKKLTSLNVSGNPFTSISIKELPVLTSLNLSNCDQLTNVVINDNKMLSKIDMTGSTKVTTYNLSGNNLSSNGDFSVIKLLESAPNLINLNVSKNKNIKTLSFTKNKKLEVLDASECGLTSIDLSYAVAVNNVSVEKNKLTSLNTVSNAELVILKADDNALTSVDCSKNAKLSVLSLENNALTSLKLYRTSAGKNSNLYIVDVNNNKLTSLDLSGLDTLTFLVVSNNQITNLDLRDCSALAMLAANGNNLSIIDIGKTNLAASSSNEVYVGPQNTGKPITVCLTNAQKSTFESDFMTLADEEVNADNTNQVKLHVHSTKSVAAGPATCTTAGSKVAYFGCTCGKWFHDAAATNEFTAKELADNKINATGHSYGSWKVTKAATVLATGTKQRVCSKCKHKDIVTLAKLKGTIKQYNDELPIKKGTTFDLNKAIYNLANGDYIKKVYSSKTHVIKVTNDGKMTALKTGKCTVKVTMASGVTAKFQVIVRSKDIKTTAITKVRKSYTIKKGKSITIYPILDPVTSTEKIKYKSLSSYIAVVEKGKITGVHKGVTKIKITSGDITKTVKITVE